MIDEMNDAMRERAGLAGTRAGNDQERAAIGKRYPAMLDGAALLGIESFQARRGHWPVDVGAEWVVIERLRLESSIGRAELNHDSRFVRNFWAIFMTAFDVIKSERKRLSLPAVAKRSPH